MNLYNTIVTINSRGDRYETLYSGEFAELIDKNPQTLREWDKKNVFKPHHVGPTGYR